MANQTLVGIRVVCDSGFDGGLEQTFHMEVLSLAENIMYGNRSRDVPSFWAGQLPAGEKIYIRLYASNSKGRSTPVILQAETSLAAGVRYNNVVCSRYKSWIPDINVRCAQLRGLRLRE